MTERSSLWTMLEMMARRRSLIFGFTMVATVVAVIVSLVLPKWYQSECLLLPPKDASATIESLSRLEEVVSVTGGLSLPVMVTPSDVYARILKSRTIADRIIDKFALSDRYKTPTRFETYEALLSHSEFSVTEEGLLRIVVEDKDAQVAADMANAFAAEVNRVNQEIVSDRSSQNRQFIEARLVQVRAELDSSRQALEQFQRDNRTVDFDEQTRLAIEQASNLKVALAQTDLEAQIAEQTMVKGHPELELLNQRRAILVGQLDRLEMGGGDSSYFSLPVAAIPRLRGQFEMLYSKVRVGEALYSTLLGELEQAKIQESKQSPSISVLDAARPAEIRSRPQRTLIVGGTFVLALILSLFLAALAEYVETLRDQRPEDYRRALFVAGAFLGWIPGVRRSRRESPDEPARPRSYKEG